MEYKKPMDKITDLETRKWRKAVEEAYGKTYDSDEHFVREYIQEFKEAFSAAWNEVATPQFDKIKKSLDSINTTLSQIGTPQTISKLFNVMDNMAHKLERNGYQLNKITSGIRLNSPEKIDLDTKPKSIQQESETLQQRREELLQENIALLKELQQLNKSITPKAP